MQHKKGCMSSRERKDKIMKIMLRCKSELKSALYCYLFVSLFYFFFVNEMKTRRKKYIFILDIFMGVDHAIRTLMRDVNIEINKKYFFISKSINLKVTTRSWGWYLTLNDLKMAR